MATVSIPLNGKHGAGKSFVVDASDREMVEARRWLMDKKGRVHCSQHGKELPCCWTRNVTKV
jgi:hypothetical protein